MGLSILTGLEDALSMPLRLICGVRTNNCRCEADVAKAVVTLRDPACKKAKHFTMCTLPLEPALQCFTSIE